MKDKTLLLLFILMPFAFISHGLGLDVGHQYFLILSATVFIGVVCDNKWIALFIGYVALWQLFLFITETYFVKQGYQCGDGFAQILFILSGASNTG